MPADGVQWGRAGIYARTALDALMYAGVVATVTVVLALVLGIVTGGGIVRAKLLLFLAGWLLVGLATVRLWPKSPRKVAMDGDGGGRSIPADPGRDTRIEAVVADLPPLRWMRRPARQLSPPTKLFIAGLFVLAISFLLEVVFAVE